MKRALLPLLVGLSVSSACGGLDARPGGTGGTVSAGGGTGGAPVGGSGGGSLTIGTGGTQPSTTSTTITPLGTGGAIGQTDFISEEPSDGYFSPIYPGDTMELVAIDGGSSVAPTTRTPPAGRVAEVEEADIYRIDGTLLYYFNTYRGLLIFDIADPKAPKLLSRSSVFGYPVEMFVSGTTVYALLRDALYLTASQGKPKFERRQVSQLVAIDASNPAKPIITKTVDIAGQLREGVSRKIEKTIYVVSYLPQGYYDSGWYAARATATVDKEQAWVYSFDVSDPKNLRQVNALQIFEGGSVRFSSNNLSYSKYFRDVSISATSNALMVAENWSVYGSASSNSSSSGCGSYESNQLAVISIIDVSDPKGAIRRHTRFETAGTIGDQFKMTYLYDDAAKTGTFFGIFARQVWSSSGCTGTSYTRNTLESWNVTDGDNPVRLGRLDFGKENETVRGTAFDLARKVAYAITAKRVDPLYALSIADPKALKVLSAVDGLSGDMSVFRLIADRQFLMAVGTDTSSTCTGFDTTSGRQGSQIAVSIIDVRDLAKVRLVQRQCVTVQGAAWSTGSAITSNLDQAHKMIGMFSDAGANVITVPVHFYAKAGNDDWWWYGYQSAVGIMAWDLSKYDDTKAETEQTVLTNFGTFVHPNGEVRRTIVYTHPTTGRRAMLNLSDTHASLVDIQELANPVEQSVVELAPYYREIYRFGDYLLEHVEPEYASSNRSHEFRVRKAADGAAAVTVASFTLGQVQRTVKVGNNLVVVGSVSRQTDAGWTTENPILVFDLSTPTAPKRAAQMVLSPSVTLPSYYYYSGWCPWSGYWSDSSNRWISTDTSLVMLQSAWLSASSSYQVSLVTLDLSDPTAPQLTTQQAFAGAKSSYDYALVPDGVDVSTFYLVGRTDVGQVTHADFSFAQYRYWAQRWQSVSGKLTSAETVNLPGPLVGTSTGSDGKRLFLTRDGQYTRITRTTRNWVDHHYQYDVRLALLREVGSESGVLAELVGARTLPGVSLTALVRDGSTVLASTRPYFDSYSAANSAAADLASDHLVIFDLSADRLDLAYDQPINAYDVRIMAAQKGRVFMNLPGDGIVVVDTAQPTLPKPIRFLRTLGYATHLESFGDDVYVASGYFGLEHMSLTEAPTILASIGP
jgi:hypothetical protein